MCTRRDAMRIGLGFVASCAIGEIDLQAQRLQRRSRGCMLSRDEARGYMNTATERRVYETGREPMILASGDREFDLALAQTLSMISDELQVLPGFAYYDDFDGANAFAIDTVRLQNSDGTVLMISSGLAAVDKAFPAGPC